MTTKERAKYTAAEIDALGGRGEALSIDGEFRFPTADEADVKAAIRAVGRSAGHDVVRAYIITRAAALTVSDLIPDNWAGDGSLSDAEKKGHVWTAEQRDTANDVFTTVAAAVADAYDVSSSSWQVWVQDWYGMGADDNPYTVVYYYSGDIWAATFTYDDDGKCSVDTATARKVRPCTTYIDRHDPKNLENRGVPKSVEWRQQRAEGMKGVERRTRFERFEIRENDDGTLHFTGYASVTGSPYDMGWYSESISRGAFKKTLSETPDVTLLLNHAGLPLARTKAGTLRLDEDDTGLKVDADLDPDDPDSQVLARKMKRGDLDGQMSFAFRAIRQTWNEDYTDRSITEADVNRGDVSVVTQGANPNTFSTIRSDDALTALRHSGPIGILESLLDLRRYAGIPKEQRVGATLSAATQEVLTQILNLCSVADDAMDDAQPILAQLLGVGNPDEDDAASETDETDSSTDAADGEDAARSASAAILEARRQLESLRYPGRDVA